jgi:YggT family protein|tara:strand:- start:237 stop:518 length:282 start_codon:yes stop_codon:yes gene_type:complete
MNTLIITLCDGIAGFLKFYIVLLTLRVYLTWFININFYTQPFLSLGKMTDPYLRVFRGIIPPIIGLDLSPLLGFILLTFLVDLFSSAANIGLN